ncbi:MAG: fructosamine kinase family protein [Vicingaceae bacterium]
MQNRLIKHIEQQLNADILSFSFVGGGSINQTFLLNTSRGNYFIKLNSSVKFPDMFYKEEKGLNTIAVTKTIQTPKIILNDSFEDTAFLILEYIPQGIESSAFWERFGASLALLHKHSNNFFGFTEDNYIGSLIQMNTPKNSWVEFFITCRLLPQIKQATHKLSKNTIERFEVLFKKLQDIFPDEKPALLHGDLWSGNFLVNQHQEPVLIDPAVYYGHREMDLAMTRLFGGFDKIFYNAYNNAFALEKGWEERADICNLYPLLVHVNLFGGAYVNSVETVLKKFT